MAGWILLHHPAAPPTHPLVLWLQVRDSAGNLNGAHPSSHGDPSLHAWVAAASKQRLDKAVGMLLEVLQPTNTQLQPTPVSPGGSVVLRPCIPADWPQAADAAAAEAAEAAEREVSASAAAAASPAKPPPPPPAANAWASNRLLKQLPRGQQLSPVSSLQRSQGPTGSSNASSEADETEPEAAPPSPGAACRPPPPPPPPPPRSVPTSPVQPAVAPLSPAQPAISPLSLVHLPAAVPHSPVQSPAAPLSLLQPAAAALSSAQLAVAAPLSPVQPAAAQVSPMQPAAAPLSPVQPAAAAVTPERQALPPPAPAQEQEPQQALPQQQGQQMATVWAKGLHRADGSPERVSRLLGCMQQRCLGPAWVWQQATSANFPVPSGSDTEHAFSHHLPCCSPLPLPRQPSAPLWPQSPVQPPAWLYQS